MRKTPTLSELEELIQLLEPGRLDANEIRLLQGLPIEEVAGRLASFHLEDQERRKSETLHNSAWQWIAAHSGYKAFVANASKKLLRGKPMHTDMHERRDPHAVLAAQYLKRLHRYEGRDDRFDDRFRLRDYLEPFGFIWVRAVTHALLETMGATPHMRQKVFSTAIRHVEKAREAISVLLDSDVVTRGAITIANGLDRSRRQLDQATARAARMKPRHGRARAFLETFIDKAGTNYCGSTAGLRRLVELVDPDSEISDDTIGRIVKKAREREERWSAYFAKQEQTKQNGDPQK